MKENRKSRVCKSDRIPFLMPLRNFLEGIKDDKRIRTTHSAVFLTLYGLWLENDGQNPIPVKKKEAMAKAKIISQMTWHRTIIELNEYGYVDYQPTYNRTRVSTVSL
nr:hypothetical protein [uncultured Pedobacter sp.]